MRELIRTICGVIAVLGMLAMPIGGHALDEAKPLSDIEAPEAVLTHLKRVRSDETRRSVAELPPGWEQIAAFRARQSDRQLDEVRAEVKRGYERTLAAAADRHQRGGPVVTVGDDDACDYTADSLNPGQGLQQALDDASSDANGADTTEILVANSGNYTGRNYYINDDLGGEQSVTIIGGYDTCSSSDPGGHTVLDATGNSSPVITIDAVDPQQTVSLENLMITGGSAEKGGGIRIGNNNWVMATNVSIDANSAENGGGIHVEDTGGDDTVFWLLNGSFIGNNTADGDGGGLYCTGGNALVAFDSFTGIMGNSANSGGGFQAQDGCHLVTFSGNPGGVVNNSVDVNGGGGIVDNGSRLEVVGGEGGFGFGDPKATTGIGGNSAKLSGGGLWVRDSVVDVTDAWIVENAADANESGNGSGGGVEILGGGSFSMDRTLAGDNCHQAMHCSRLSGNTGWSGGAVWADGNGTSVDIRQTWIDSNQTNGGTGTAIRISNFDGDSSQPAQLFMEGNMIVENPTGSEGGLFRGVVDVQTNSSTTIAFTTFAGNLAESVGRNLIGFDDVSLNVYSSIFWESTGEVYLVDWDNASVDGEIDCAIVHELESLPNNDESTVFEDPEFDQVDPHLSRYHLTGTSPAINFCDTALYSPLEPDIDGESRGQPLGGSDLFGPYDLGADEHIPDKIFSDRFEM